MVVTMSMFVVLFFSKKTHDSDGDDEDKFALLVVRFETFVRRSGGGREEAAMAQTSLDQSFAVHTLLHQTDVCSQTFFDFCLTSPKDVTFVTGSTDLSFAALAPSAGRCSEPRGHKQSERL